MLTGSLTLSLQRHIKRLMKSQMALTHVLLFLESLVINLLDWVQIKIKIIHQQMLLMSI